MADDLQNTENQGEIGISTLSTAIWQPIAADFNPEEFVGISFTHHIEILNKTKKYSERIFYIHQAYINKWDKYKLRDMLKADLYSNQKHLAKQFCKGDA